MAAASGYQHNQGGTTPVHGRGNKRQQSRIQGGWAPLQVSRGGRGRSQGQPRRRASQPLYHARSPGPYHEQSACNHLHNNIGQPSDVNRYMYEAPAEPINIHVQTKPLERMINENGKQDLSSEPSGPSVVELIHDFLGQEEADRFFSNLDESINWKQQVNKNRAGEEYDEPRLVAWYGEHPYAYSKVKMQANTVWPPELLEVKNKIEERAGITFNSVLANKYRSGRDGVAWHSDDEYGLRDKPTIASLSLGAERMFEMRKKPPKGSYDMWDYSNSERLKIPLKHGTLLIMSEHTQDDWQHQVPKEYHEREMRINLTFRNIYPDERLQGISHY